MNSSRVRRGLMPSSMVWRQQTNSIRLYDIVNRLRVNPNSKYSAKDRTVVTVHQTYSAVIPRGLCGHTV